MLISKEIYNDLKRTMKSVGLLNDVSSQDLLEAVEKFRKGTLDSRVKQALIWHPPIFASGCDMSSPEHELMSLQSMIQFA